LSDSKCFYDISLLFLLAEENDAEDVKKCDCKQDCNSIEYEIQVIKTNLKVEHQWMEVNNMSHWVNTTYFGALSIAFSNNEYTAFKRFASYGTISFLSNVGGLLSLFLGVSVMSFIEIFYFLVIRLTVEFVKFLSRKKEKRRVHSTDLSKSLEQIDF
jgi:Amiloride-sensitive sodium channel